LHKDKGPSLLEDILQSGKHLAMIRNIHVSLKDLRYWILNPCFSKNLSYRQNWFS